MQAKYRHALPQMGDEIFLTDGGIETTLIFHDGIELPHFAAFDLLRTRRGPGGAAALLCALCRGRPARRARAGARERDLAVEPGVGRGARLRAGGARRGERRRRSRFSAAIREAEETAARPMVLSGCLGPRGDGYAPDRFMSAAEAEAYHGRQVRVFEAAGADMVTAMTMTYVEEGGRHRPGGEGGRHPGGDLLHRRDRRLPAHGHGARRGDRGLRRGDRRLSGLLHGELRASDALPRPADRRRLDGADRRHPGERLEDEPCRARRGAGARSRRPGGARAGLSRR